MPSTKKIPTWVTLNTDDIFVRSCFSCGVHDNRYIIAAGGINQKSRWLLSSAAMYNTKTSSRIDLPDLPFSGGCCGTILHGYFYVVRNVTFPIYRICLSTLLKWEVIDDDIRISATAIVTDGNHLFIFNLGHQMYRFDPYINELVEMPLLVNPRGNFATAVVNNKIYVIGGQFTRSVEVFDINTLTWSKAPPLPKKLQNASATEYGQWILVSGGQYDHGSKWNTEIFAYDTLNQRWTVNNHGLSPPRKVHSCVAVGSRIITMGGWDNSYSYCPTEAIHIKSLVLGWEMVKDFVLLRRLVDDGRAYPKISTKRVKKDTGVNTKIERVIYKLFTDLPLDVFRNILSFHM